MQFTLYHSVLVSSLQPSPSHLFPHSLYFSRPEHLSSSPDGVVFSHTQALSPAVPSVCNTSSHPCLLAHSYLCFKSQFSSHFLHKFFPDLHTWVWIPAPLLPLSTSLIAISPSPTFIFWLNVVSPEIFFGWLQLLKNTNKQILPLEKKETRPRKTLSVLRIDVLCFMVKISKVKFGPR